MKQEAMALAAGESDPGRKLNLLREYLQAFALRSLHESGAFAHLSFVGGTALRFLFGLRRFSEDLDFSLETPDGYALGNWAAKLERDLRFAGFEPSISLKQGKAVEIAWIGVTGILQELRLSALSSQKLSIKLEIDTRPPPGAATETRIMNRFFLMGIRHHALACLMAGKIRELLTRRYPKGRDWYDLLWYRSRVPAVEPDLGFLKACLDQGPEKAILKAGDWRDDLAAKAEAADWPALVKDVAPFLENPAERNLLSAGALVQVLTRPCS